MRISDWSSDVCSSDLHTPLTGTRPPEGGRPAGAARSYLRKMGGHHVEGAASAPPPESRRWRVRRHCGPSAVVEDETPARDSETDLPGRIDPGGPRPHR